MNKILAESRYYALYLQYAGFLKIHSKTEQLQKGRVMKPVLDELLHEVAISVYVSRGLLNEDDKISHIEAELHTEAREAAAMFWNQYTPEEIESQLFAQTT